MTDPRDLDARARELFETRAFLPGWGTWEELLPAVRESWLQAARKERLGASERRGHD